MPGTAAPAAPRPRPTREPTTDILARLGGRPCPDGSEFTCVTVPMPLDHFDPSDTRTIDVTFAVKPATGARKGAFVTATGGPGYSGISVADYYTSFFEPSVPRRFDLVFFDQRGLALSGGLTCPQAARPTTGPIRRPARRPRSGRSRRRPAGSAPTARSRPAAPTCCPTWARRRRPRTSSRSASSSRTTGGGSTASRTAPSSPRPTPPPTRSTSAGWCSTAPST